MKAILKHKRVLVTGGAGFIGSNLCERLIDQGNIVTCLDNFATGYKHNLDKVINHPNFTLIEGDIRSFEDCKRAVKGQDVILHQAALGSVPRSVKDPITSNDVNVNGFVNMLWAAKEAEVKRFVYAASSSTYGDSKSLPKVEENIGKPLSPYAVTKYVNELYADVFSKTYGIETIGLRYFNVFGPKQDPNGAYAAVIPKFVSFLLKGDSPMINGDGEYSRDFTFVENVIMANQLAATVDNHEAVNTVYNVACEQRTNLNQLVDYLKEGLSEFDPTIKNIEPTHGSNRVGDIPHSLASVQKAKDLLGYNPEIKVREGILKACEWYYNNLK
ncbi:MAG: SDR family oxidoreductase [Hyphomicrobiales bacterium]